MQTTKLFRLPCLLLAALLALSLAACGSQAADPMSEEEYIAAVETLETGATDMLTTLFGMSTSDAEDEAAMRDAAETLRGTVAPFKDFAAIANPPEAYAELHAKLAEGCSLFAGSIETLCDSAVKYLDGEITEEEFNESEALSEDANRGIELLTEGFEQFEELTAGSGN